MGGCGGGGSGVGERSTQPSLTRVAEPIYGLGLHLEAHSPKERNLSMTYLTHVLKYACFSA